MSPEQYEDLRIAFMVGDKNDCRAAFETIQVEVDNACNAEGFTREQCFELLVDIRNLLDVYTIEQLG